MDHYQVERPKRLPMSVQEPETCYKCHPKIYGLNALPYHHPIKEGKMVCSDCHDPHGQYLDNLSDETVNMVCYRCHAEKQGPFTFEHPPVTERCTICHEPHGTVAKDLLRKPVTFLCLQCHAGHAFSSTGFNGLPTTGTGSNHGDIVNGSPSGPSTKTYTAANFQKAFYTDCTHCHNQIHGTDRAFGRRPWDLHALTYHQRPRALLGPRAPLPRTRAGRTAHELERHSMRRRASALTLICAGLSSTARGDTADKVAPNEQPPMPPAAAVDPAQAEPQFHFVFPNYCLDNEAVSQDVARFGYWGTHTSGSPVKVGEYQNLGASPFYDFDGLHSDGQRTLNYTITGMDADTNAANLNFYQPGVEVNVNYQRFPHDLGHENLGEFFRGQPHRHSRYPDCLAVSRARPQSR